MRYLFLIPVICSCFLCCTPQIEKSNDLPKEQSPKVSFTFDDGITRDILHYPFEAWNEMILAALDSADLKAIFFVTGFNKSDDKGQYLLDTWDKSGHRIANHTFSHPNFSDPKNTVANFENELLRTDSLIHSYANYIPLFRFPYLKEGKTRSRIDSIRAVLEKHNYRNGHVTIDASDWYINSRLIKKMSATGKEKVDVETYKNFYLEHILARANYYEQLSYEMNKRHILHTLLLHHNLTSALFLNDLIERFKAEGWEVIDADLAYQDRIFKYATTTIPAGESLIWSMAKEKGMYDAQLRYPAEDSRYEAPKMDSLGL
ncbi:MAG: polysaccharide deacetylase family protein [Bacteroidota bacterium]